MITITPKLDFLVPNVLVTNAIHSHSGEWEREIIENILQKVYVLMVKKVFLITVLITQLL